MADKLKMTRSSGNVFADLGFPPAEAQNLLLRTTLMIAIEKFIADSGLSQRAAAARLGVTAPRLNDLLRGKIEKFSLDALVTMLARVDLRVELKVSRAPTRRKAG